MADNMRISKILIHIRVVLYEGEISIEVSSGVLRMLELKEENMPGVNIDNIDGAIFDPIINSMPAERTDKKGHQNNYDAMLKIIDKAVKTCSAKGCYNVQAEDLQLKEEECSHQKLQLSYWLHIISFRQLFSDTELSFPNEIIAMTPSSKKVPECRLPPDAADDFFLERVSKVDSEGWEPILSLMHQFAEMFNFYDYITLGAKITKYIDTKGKAGAAWGAWWCGAGGRGACARRCALTAATHHPHHPHHPHHRHHALSALAAMLHMQSKPHDGKDMAYLSFYASPKSKVEAFLVAVSHTYLGEYEKAVWMYRYALTFDEKFLPAKACLQATMCLMLFEQNPDHVHAARAWLIAINLQRHFLLVLNFCIKKRLTDY